MTTEIRTKLELMAEEKYKEFSSSLIRKSAPLLGIRLPILRDMAKAIVKSGEWREVVVSDPKEDIYFEETMLRGMIIGQGTAADKDINEAIRLFNGFVPLVDNWSVCDSFCVSMTIFETYPKEGLEVIQPLLYSAKEFEVRVGLVILLDHFLKVDKAGKKIKRLRSVTMQDLDNPSEETGKYTQDILKCIDRPFLQGYYTQMAAAWLFAECFVTYPSAAAKYLNNSKMDDFTYKKALSKICESRIPQKEVKDYIKKLKSRNGD